MDIPLPRNVETGCNLLSQPAFKVASMTDQCPQGRLNFSPWLCYTLGVCNVSQIAICTFLIYKEAAETACEGHLIT
jgi:hypothetical protein